MLVGISSLLSLDTNLGFLAHRLVKAHKHVPVSDGFQTEWEYGGCPFAR